MKLAQLQDQFQSHLMEPECHEAAWVAPSVKDLSSSMRLGIYHNAYRVRLAETLLDTFEHTHDYITSELFDTLAYAYVEKYPSQHTNIGYYGQYFADYLKSELPAGCQEVPEIAEMDWSLRRAFDGANADVLTKHKLEQLITNGGEFTDLTLVPTLTLITQKFNSLDIWNAVNQEQDIPPIVEFETPLIVMIWRKEHSPHFRSLSPLEATAIQQLQSNSTIETLCEVLANEFPEIDIATEFGSMLARWLDDHILALA